MDIIDKVIFKLNTGLSLQYTKELLEGKVAIELVGDKKTLDHVKASVWDWAFELGTIEACTSEGPLTINPNKESEDYLNGAGRSPAVVASELLLLEHVTLPWGTIKLTEDMDALPMTKLIVK